MRLERGNRADPGRLAVPYPRWHRRADRDLRGRDQHRRAAGAQQRAQAGRPVQRGRGRRPAYATGVQAVDRHLVRPAPPARRADRKVAMRCAACTATACDWDLSPLCPSCYAVAGGRLPAAEPPAGSPLWLWASGDAAPPLAPRHLTAILKACRAATATRQAALAASLGDDTSYLSMIDNAPRAVSHG